MGSSQSSFGNVIPLSLDGHIDATLELYRVVKGKSKEYKLTPRRVFNTHVSQILHTPIPTYAPETTVVSTKKIEPTINPLGAFTYTETTLAPSGLPQVRMIHSIKCTITEEMRSIQEQVGNSLNALRPYDTIHYMSSIRAPNKTFTTGQEVRVIMNVVIIHNDNIYVGWKLTSMSDSTPDGDDPIDNVPEKDEV